MPGGRSGNGASLFLEGRMRIAQTAYFTCQGDFENLTGASALARGGIRVVGGGFDPSKRRDSKPASALREGGSPTGYPADAFQPGGPRAYPVLSVFRTGTAGRSRHRGPGEPAARVAAGYSASGPSARFLEADTRTPPYFPFKEDFRSQPRRSAAAGATLAVDDPRPRGDFYTRRTRPTPVVRAPAYPAKERISWGRLMRLITEGGGEGPPAIPSTRSAKSVAMPPFPESTSIPPAWT